jgi:hypothetical protein
MKNLEAYLLRGFLFWGSYYLKNKIAVLGFGFWVLGFGFWVLEIKYFNLFIN